MRQTDSIQEWGGRGLEAIRTSGTRRLLPAWVVVAIVGCGGGHGEKPKTGAGGAGGFAGSGTGIGGSGLGGAGGLGSGLGGTSGIGRGHERRRGRRQRRRGRRRRGRDRRGHERRRRRWQRHRRLGQRGRRRDRLRRRRHRASGSRDRHVRDRRAHVDGLAGRLRHHASGRRPDGHFSRANPRQSAIGQLRRRSSGSNAALDVHRTQRAPRDRRLYSVSGLNDRIRARTRTAPDRDRARRALHQRRLPLPIDCPRARRTGYAHEFSFHRRLPGDRSPGLPAVAGRSARALLRRPRCAQGPARRVARGRRHAGGRRGHHPCIVHVGLRPAGADRPRRRLRRDRRARRRQRSPPHHRARRGRHGGPGREGPDPAETRTCPLVAATTTGFAVLLEQSAAIGADGTWRYVSIARDGGTTSETWTGMRGRPSAITAAGGVVMVFYAEAVGMGAFCGGRTDRNNASRCATAPGRSSSRTPRGFSCPTSDPPPRPPAACASSPRSNVSDGQRVPETRLELVKPVRPSTRSLTAWIASLSCIAIGPMLSRGPRASEAPIDSGRSGSVFSGPVARTDRSSNDGLGAGGQRADHALATARSSPQPAACNRRATAWSHVAQYATYAACRAALKSQSPTTTRHQRSNPHEQEADPGGPRAELTP